MMYLRQKNVGRLRLRLLQYLVLVAVLLIANHCSGQGKITTEKVRAIANMPRPTDIKILEEHKDAAGNTVRTIQYYQSGARVTEKITIPSLYNIRVPINPDTMLRDSIMVIVSKSKYCVEVYYRRRKIRAYKAVFGPKPLENKKMEGDRNTPEGWYSILNKNPKSKYNKFMLLSYPDDSAIARFNALKTRGAIPQSARIGGDVGIHGIWKGGDDMIEMGVCWTDGCVAVKNTDIDDLYTLVSVGTRVYIRK